MPSPLDFLGAASGLVGGLANMFSQGSANRANERLANEMFDKQKQKDIDFFNMTNAYNTPAAQMKRFEDAGLNPNLVYGQMSNAAPVHSSTTPTASVQSVRAGDAVEKSFASMNMLADLRLKKAQSDNVAANTKDALAAAALKAGQLAQTNAATRLANANAGFSEWNTGYQQSMASFNKDYLNARIRSTDALTDNALEANFRANQVQPYQIAKMISENRSIGDANDRANARFASDLALIASSIQLNRANTARSSADRSRILSTIPGILTDNKIKSLDEKLKSSGLSWQDPIYWRLGNMFLKGKDIFGTSSLGHGSDGYNWFNRPLSAWLK